MSNTQKTEITKKQYIKNTRYNQKPIYQKKTTQCFNTKKKERERERRKKREYKMSTKTRC